MSRFHPVRIITAVYRKVIKNETKEVNFWILVFFILTFTVSRLTVYFLPDLYLSIRHTHIHHYAYGILILAIVGILALNDWHHKKRRIFGSIYGIGLGLAMDEFGMWIRLEDDYWVRHSYDALTITSAILVLAVYFDDFWGAIIKRLKTEQSKA